MKLIERYIFKKASFAGLIVLGSLLGVVWIVQALRQVDIIATNGQSILTYLSITTLAVPGLILAIIPIALLLATIHTVNAMNANSELVVISASGFSNLRIAKPLILLAFVCSLITGVVGHYLTPLSLAELRDRITEVRADLITVIIKEGTFNTVEKNLTFHISERGAGGILRGVLISDDRDPDVSIIYSAKEGIVIKRDGQSFLLLKDGDIHQKDQKDGSVTVVKYQSYFFDLSSFSGASRKKLRKAKERTTLELLSPDPDDPVFKSSPGRFRSQIHERFSEMLWPFAYVFIILAFAGQARSSRQSFAASVTSAFTVVVIVRGMGFSSISSLKANPDAVIYPYLFPAICIVVGGAFVLTNTAAALPKPVSDRIDTMNRKISSVGNHYMDVYKQYLRRRAGVKT